LRCSQPNGGRPSNPIGISQIINFLLKIRTMNEGEKIKRSVVKTVSWRLIGTIATIVISYFITGTMALAFSIGIIEMISKMILYFFHERAWSQINWGK